MQVTAALIIESRVNRSLLIHDRVLVLAKRSTLHPRAHQVYFRLNRAVTAHVQLRHNHVSPRRLRRQTFQTWIHLYAVSRRWQLRHMPRINTTHLRYLLLIEPLFHITKVQVLQLLQAVSHQSILRLNKLVTCVLGVFETNRTRFVRKASHLESFDRSFVVLCVGAADAVIVKAHNVLLVRVMLSRLDLVRYFGRCTLEFLSARLSHTWLGQRMLGHRRLRHRILSKRLLSQIVTSLLSLRSTHQENTLAVIFILVLHRILNLIDLKKRRHRVIIQTLPIADTLQLLALVFMLCHHRVNRLQISVVLLPEPFELDLKLLNVLLTCFDTQGKFTPQRSFIFR